MVLMHFLLKIQAIGASLSKLGHVTKTLVFGMLVFLGFLSSPAWSATQQEWFIDQAYLTGMSLPRRVVLPHVLVPEDFSP